jgi:hypothetical protein
MRCASRSVGCDTLLFVRWLEMILGFSLHACIGWRSFPQAPAMFFEAFYGEMGDCNVRL